MHILRCMGSKFCVKFQRAPLKFNTKFWTHTPQNMNFTVFYFCVWVTISLNCDVISLSETGPSTPRRLQLANSMLSDNRGTYFSRISTHIDIAPATNHNKQHWILIIMQQNCQITRCARQHMMDSVLKSAKLRRFTHALSALRGRVSPKLDELLGDKFANRISNKISTFSTQ